ncbi:MAG: SPOR domain-containing protein [Firmicutes bacterium]|nr:SPOR domain-containing protein [Bacillota bacterium]
MRRRGSSSIGSYVPFLLFVIVLGAVAIASGYFLGKFFMSSLSSLTPPAVKDKLPPPQEAQRPAPVVTLSAPGMSLYRVQAGLFSVKANADRLAASLKKAGIPAAIVGTNQYRVIVALLPSSESANRVVQSVKSKGFEAMVGKYEIQGSSFTAPGDEYGEALKAVIEASWSGIDRSLKAADAYIAGRRADAKDIVEAASVVNAARQKLSAAKAPAGSEAVHKAAEGLLDHASSALASLSAAASSGQPAPSILGDIAGAVLGYERAIGTLPKD